MSDGYDVVVIGSGFGGAVTACRLAKQGFSVLVLERGRRWNIYPTGASDLRNLLWSQSLPSVFNGWVDLRLFRRMWVAQGCGVGGGSLIYANVSVNARPEAFATGWPTEITYEMLEPYYDRVAHMLRPEKLPATQHTERYRLVERAARRTGAVDRFADLPLAVTFDEDWSPGTTAARDGYCNGCGRCVIGCPQGARHTLDTNYLAEAERHDAKVNELCRARSIAPNNDGYVVEYERIVPGRWRAPREYVMARRVIVAAGSLGSTELLLQCRDWHKTLPKISRCLGYNWGSNGDFFTLAFHPFQRINPSVGPTISSAIDHLDAQVFGEQLFVQDGGFPRELVGNRFFGYLAPRIMPWFGQAADTADARLFLRRSWILRQNMTLDLYWKPRRSRAVFDAFLRAHRQLSRRTGGWPLASLWSLLGILITPHPLGWAGAIWGRPLPMEWSITADRSSDMTASMSQMARSFRKRLAGIRPRRSRRWPSTSRRVSSRTCRHIDRKLSIWVFGVRLCVRRGGTTSARGTTSSAG